MHNKKGFYHGLSYWLREMIVPKDLKEMECNNTKSMDL